MSQNEIENILSTVKTMLKNRNMNYKDFAAFMNMSESGVKKLLNGSDLSMSRTIQIADVLAVPLAEIVKASERIKAHEIRLNDEQKAFFLENINYFYFFSTLVEHTYGRDYTQELTGLSDASVDQYMLKLAELGLIKLSDDARPTVCWEFIREARKGHGVSVFIGAQLNRLVRKELCGRLIDTADDLACNGSDVYDAETIAKISEAFIQRRFRLTVESIDSLRQSLRELIKTYGKLSSIEQATYPKEKLVDIGWTYALAPFDGRYRVSEV